MYPEQNSHFPDFPLRRRLLACRAGRNKCSGKKRSGRLLHENSGYDDAQHGATPLHLRTFLMKKQPSEVHTPLGVLAAADAFRKEFAPIDLLILEHSRLWNQVGIYLRCRNCGETQRASQSASIFKHAPQCSIKTGSFPWTELSDLLQKLPRL